MIMVAGGLTFAIPGALPQAVAQTGMLSVSSTEMGGYQVLEVEINDPDKKALDVNYGDIGATLDGDTLTMVQADTGIWYGYVRQDLTLPGGLTDADLISGAPNQNSDDEGTNLVSTTIPDDFEVQTNRDLSDGFTIEYRGESVDVEYDDDLTRLGHNSTGQDGHTGRGPGTHYHNRSEAELGSDCRGCVVPVD